MIGTITAVVLAGAISAWGLWLVIKSQRTEHHQRRSVKLYSALRAAHREDTHWVNDNCPCASCGGEATRTHYNAETRQFLCVDRELCRRTMIHESMLDSL